MEYIGKELALLKTYIVRRIFLSSFNSENTRMILSKIDTKMILFKITDVPYRKFLGSSFNGSPEVEQVDGHSIRYCKYRTFHVRAYYFFLSDPPSFLEHLHI